MVSTPRRHRRSRGNDLSTPGWDLPPPVASPVDGIWQPRGCNWKTPQHLATLQLPDISIHCDPLILNNQKSILAASSFGDLYLFTNFEECWKVTLPVSHLSLPSDATIVSMQKMGEEILVLSVEGRIHRVAVVGGKIELQSSWKMSRQCGATCMQPLQSQNTLLLGYESGHIEARNMDKEASLKWTGYFHYPIRSLSTLKKSKSSSNSDKVDEMNRHQPDATVQTETTDDFFLVVTLQPEIGNGHHTTASMVEVLDLSAIPESDNAINLYPYARLPEPGMELVDSDTLPANDSGKLPKRVQVLPSRGSDVVFSLKEDLVGVALSDGTLAFVSTLGDSAWGIAKDRSQLLLSYPAVGYGKVSYNGTDHWVCCLRAGTCFLIPTSYDDEADITVISYPLDIETDMTSPYVQGFTAGTLAVRNEAPSAVLVYAWAGGVIDVYGCNLVYPQIPPAPEAKSHTEAEAMKEMAENGCLTIISGIFKKMTENPQHELFQQTVWQEAHESCASVASRDPITVEQLQSSELGPLKRLLLSLASK